MEVTRESLPEFAKKFVEELPSMPGTRAHVVGLSGELGAGKTTFVQDLARTLDAGEGVTSPTFVIAQRYPVGHPPFSSLVHIDAYRLQPGEAHTIGWAEYMQDPKNLVLVEWPEKLGSDFPSDAPVLKFAVIDETKRSIEYGRI